MREPPRQNDSSRTAARRLRVDGRVQGVGFRPFVYRLAHSMGLGGWVQNQLGEVEVWVEGPPERIAAFTRAVIDQAPPLARPNLVASETVTPTADGEFTIRSSRAQTAAAIHVPPDYFACDDCLRELEDPADRRYRYPFINCTQCGPRYTLICRLPYDRPNTTMAAFELCPACRAEYDNPLDRRFHAQPLACPDCGPQLEFVAGTHRIGRTDRALSACTEALRAGGIVAVKGIGGYHLMCDARNDAAVLQLRQRKHRPAKPLAVMIPRTGTDGLAAMRTEVALDETTAEALLDPVRPIVLARRRPACTLSPHIAPGLEEVGVMLPYSPLHQLLLGEFGGPLVATSANLSGEPVLTDNEEVTQRLSHVAESFLHHNRPIERPADDPVLRVIAGRPRPLRLGRGNAPRELTLPAAVDVPLLAVGGHMKNTVALAWDRRVVISPHVGDLEAPRSIAVFEAVAADLQALYGVRAERLVCDAHRGYASSRWARRQGLPVTPVFHHRAHASAIAGEFADAQGEPGQDEEPWLVFTWDGVGLGEDGTLWGGEALLGQPGQWQRLARLRPMFLPGGEKTGREPWRSALAACWETGLTWPEAPPEAGPLHGIWQRRLNCPQSSAAGRLFDAAAALLGLIERASFEGQGPMLLEAICRAAAEPVALPLHEVEDGLWETDWSPLIAMLLDRARPRRERAAAFHASLAQVLRDQARLARERHGVQRIGLSGGVFQNRLLSETALAGLREDGFDAYLGVEVPSNDAGLSYGQVIEVLALPKD
ncbi:MAG: carbamoyltransferase HypF [Gammaproteobacteria bacterium]